MKDKYTPGQDCKCHAYSESECGCDVDWTPAEVYELRGKLAAEQARADRLERERDEWAERWADLSRASVNDICAQRERDAERALADRLAGYICDIHDVTSSRKVLKITMEACKTWWTHRKEDRSEWGR